MKYLILILSFFLLLTGCTNKKEETKEEKINVEAKEVINKEEKQEDVPIVKEEVTKENKTIVKNKSNSEEKQKEIVYSDKDKELISAFNTIESDVEVLLINSNENSVKDKAKGVFISIVDFIFYDGEIKGVTFNELTEAGKEKVLKIASSIDLKIENKIPNYKETISDKTSQAFMKASEIIKNGAKNVNNFAKEKLGDEYYQEIIDSKDELVKYTKHAFSIIGNVSSNLFNKGKDALSTWYQNFKNKN